jgi:hypothetical protein
MMKKHLKEEFELLRGVPDFELRQAVEKMTAEIEHCIRRYIPQRASNDTFAQRSDLYDSIARSLDELEEEVYELVKMKLQMNIRS